MKTNRARRTAQRGITNAQKALLHVAKTQLGLSEDEYRDVLRVHGGGAASSRDLTLVDFRAVLKHFQACGFKQLYRPQTATSEAPDLAALPEGKRGVMVLIGHTLRKLEKPWAYAAGVAAQMFGLERLEWCDKEQLQKVLAALVYASRKAAKATKEKGPKK